MSIVQKVPYICGPLTELDPLRMRYAKNFYERIAECLDGLLEVRSFVPHMHYDPERHCHFTPRDVDLAERDQVCNRTSLLVVVAVDPSWGGGIEVEMANQSGVPAVVLCEEEKLRNRKISRLLRGNPAVRAVIEYYNIDQALARLAKWVNSFADAQLFLP